jgi:hypothetical protein
MLSGLYSLVFPCSFSRVQAAAHHGFRAHCFAGTPFTTSVVNSGSLSFHRHSNDFDGAFNVIMCSVKGMKDDSSDGGALLIADMAGTAPGADGLRVLSSVQPSVYAFSGRTLAHAVIAPPDSSSCRRITTPFFSRTDCLSTMWPCSIPDCQCPCKKVAVAPCHKLSDADLAAHSAMTACCHTCTMCQK